MATEENVDALKRSINEGIASGRMKRSAAAEISGLICSLIDAFINISVQSGQGTGQPNPKLVTAQSPDGSVNLTGYGHAELDVIIFCLRNKINDSTDPFYHFGLCRGSTTAWCVESAAFYLSMALA